MKVRSLTFVPVGPVMMSSPAAARKAKESFRSRQSAASRPARTPVSIVAAEAYAPAASELPSLPSVANDVRRIPG